MNIPQKKPLDKTPSRPQFFLFTIAAGMPIACLDRVEEGAS
jgi:hypothetical protein